MRFVISGRKEGRPYCYYVSRHGCITTTGEKAAVIIGLNEAKKEVDYWRTHTGGYRWFIERLPKRVSVGKGVLHSEEIEY